MRCLQYILPANHRSCFNTSRNQRCEVIGQRCRIPKVQKEAWGYFCKIFSFMVIEYFRDYGKTNHILITVGNHRKSIIGFSILNLFYPKQVTFWPDKYLC